MKTFLLSLLATLGLATSMASGAATPATPVGTWQGRLEVAPGQSIAIHFVIAAQPGGGYTAIVTSPDSGAIRNVPAKSVTFTGNRLTLDVPALSGGYAGTLGNGVLEGEWSQEGKKLPLSLRPFEKAALSAADIEQLRGEWSGRFAAQGIEVTIVLRFTPGNAGVLRTTMDVPEQGVKDWEGKDVALDDGHFSVEIPNAATRITGTLKGDQIVGQWTQLGNSFPLTLKKGKYAPAPVYLSLPAAALEKLKGRWNATMGPMTLVVRFEKDAQGRTVGFMDSPQQNIQNTPITEASVAGTKVTFAVAGFGGKYTGELAGDKLAGEWTQVGMPKPAPLTFTRAK